MRRGLLPRRLPPRRAAAIRETGRIVLAIGPVIAVVLASSQGERWTERIIAVVVVVDDLGRGNAQSATVSAARL